MKGSARRPGAAHLALPVSWTIHREVALLLGWGRAILMQFAHPLVARAVAEHSAFRAEAFGGWRRLHRTLGTMLALTFGSPDEAQRAADRINAIHDRIGGRLGRAEGPFAEGTHYSACDPALLGWVHATLVDSFLLAYELYVRPLSPAERDAYCVESAEIEPLLRIPTGSLPRSAAELSAYVATRLEGGEIRVTDTARDLAREILFPPMSAPAWPALVVLRLATVGLLPSAVRAGYGFAWDPRRAVALRASAAVIRGLLPVVPTALRHWPAARAAVRRGVRDSADAIIRRADAPIPARSIFLRRSVMKAVRIHAPGGPEAMRYEDAPEPTPKAGEAVVKVEAAGINYIDVYFRSGQYKADLPLTLGMEAGGTVSAVGAGVTDVKVGDKVAYTGISGAYAQYAAVPAARLVTMPAGVSAKQGAAAMLQGMTAHYLATATYPLKPGDTCLVHAAAGGVGLLLCQIAKMRGARVIGTVSTEDKAKLAREAGAAEVILYTTQDFEVEVKRLTDGKGVHVVYDSVGKTTFDKGFNVLRPRGVMALYGQSSGPTGPFDLQVLNAKGSLFVTRPSLNHHVATREELVQRAGEVLGWIRDGKLKLRTEYEFPLKEAAEAHRALEGRKTTGKVLLVP